MPRLRKSSKRLVRSRRTSPTTTVGSISNYDFQYPRRRRKAVSAGAKAVRTMPARTRKKTPLGDDFIHSLIRRRFMTNEETSRRHSDRGSAVVRRGSDNDVARRNSKCAVKAQRRAVLLAKGRVNRPGGAPGPYKPRDREKCKKR